MAEKNTRKTRIGKIKLSTDDMIEGAVARQNSWMARRRDFAKSFLKKLNVFARSSNIGEKKARAVAKENRKMKAAEMPKEGKSGVMAYWFPILCTVIVIAVAVWAVFIRSDVNVIKSEETIVVVPEVPEPIVQEIKTENESKAIDSKKSDKLIEVINEKVVPSFDIVRIEPTGTIVIAGRWLPQRNVSVVVNNKVIATEHTDLNGEFVYAPVNAFKPGNYTISLVSIDNIKSVDKVFIYISDKGYQNSVSLLMKKVGGKLLKSPKLSDGELTDSKIAYLESGRIVVLEMPCHVYVYH